jgi:sulfide:quinone oxidoreductase
MSADQPGDSLQVVIAGGGVAALEATLALRELAGDLVEVTLVAPTDRFTFAPASVGAPFGKSVIRQFDLFRIANDLGVRLVVAAVAAVEPDLKRVILGDGRELAYHALLIACGASAREAVPGATTFRGPADVDSMRTLLGEVAEGSVDRLLFAMPASLGWTLPLYELCLLTGRYLVEHDYVHHYANGNRRRTPPQIGLVTPEAAPLGAFGSEASAAVATMLGELGVSFHAGQTPVRFHDGRLETLPGGDLMADRVLAMPRLEGTQITGIPVNSDGFIRTDRNGRVNDLIDVYAAGDATAFPIKQGGIAAQQAVAAAQSIAADAGADVTPEPFEPVLRGLLVTGAEERYLRSEMRGGAGQASSIAQQALWWPPGKLAAQYLTPYLARLADDPTQAL